MNEQGIAWMVTGSRRDPSPEDLRYRALARGLRASRPARPGLRDRVAALIAGRPTTQGTSTLTADCCAA